MTEKESTIKEEINFNEALHTPGQLLIQSLELTERNSDPLNTAAENEKKSKRYSLLEDVASALLPRIKNPVGIIINVSENETKKSTERSEKDALKQRIVTMKRRFLMELETPEKAQAEKERAAIHMRLKREKEKVMETPEELVTRMEKRKILAAISRKRIRALETPEQRAERMAKDRERIRLKRQKQRASETAEERAARRQHQREYNLQVRKSHLSTRTGKTWKKRQEKLSQDAANLEGEIFPNSKTENSNAERFPFK